MEEGLHVGIQHFPGLCRTLRRKCQTQHLRLQAVYLLFILPSIWFARSFYVESKLVTLKALRFAIILPVAFTAVVFIEVPKMIWQDRATELVSSGLETFIVVAVINLILLGLTYRFKPSNTPAP